MNAHMRGVRAELAIFHRRTYSSMIGIESLGGMVDVDMDCMRRQSRCLCQKRAEGRAGSRPRRQPYGAHSVRLHGTLRRTVTASPAGRLGQGGKRRALHRRHPGDLHQGLDHAPHKRGILKCPRRYGSEGLERLPPDIDLVINDYNMPGIYGIAVIRAVRESEVAT